MKVFTDKERKEALSRIVGLLIDNRNEREAGQQGQRTNITSIQDHRSAETGIERKKAA